MKIIQFPLTIYFLLFVSAVTAQSSYDFVQISWGDRIPVPNGYSKVGYVGDLENGFIQITQKSKRKVAFARISEELKYQDSNRELLPKSKYHIFENIIQVDNKAYVMMDDYDKKKKSEKLLVREIDIVKGGFKGPSVQIVSTDGKVAEPLKYTGPYDYRLDNKFNVIIPNKGNRILVFYRMKSQDKGNLKKFDKITYHLFDRDWNLIWTKEVTMPYAKSDLKIIGHRMVDNNIYLFVRTKSGAINLDTYRAEFDGVSVLLMNDTLPSAKEYVLEFEGTNIFNIILGEGKNNSILMAGYLKPTRNAENFNGYFTAVFNAKKFRLENVNSFTFKKELITAFKDEKTKMQIDKAIAAGEDPGISDLEMRKIILRPDGGWYVIGEQYDWYKEARYRSSPIYHYFFWDIVVASVGSDGIEEWVVKLPKKQHYINTTYGAGISAFEYDDNIYIFHLDHMLNKQLNDSIPPVIYGGYVKDATLICTKISRQGEIERKPILDIKDNEKVIIPADMEEMKSGILMSAGRKNASWSYSHSNRSALIYLD